MGTVTTMDRQAVIDAYEQHVITSMVAAIEPVVVERGEGAYLIDADGQRYLDGFAGISVSNAGHSHPRILAAAQEQMAKLVHCGTYVYHNPAAARFARELASVMPGAISQSFFANSGAEAVEGALRLAKQYTGKREVIALSGSFHGRTAGTLSITGNWARKKHSGPYLSGVAFAPAPYAYRCPFGSGDEEACALACAEALEDVIRYQTSGDVAAFIAEPVLGEGGIIVPPPSYFRYIADICKRHEICFIADEVQSGFGRCGTLLAIEASGVEPDIITTAKGIAAGFPLGAFSASAEIAAAFTPGDHLSTFGGNPVSCAAASANLAVLQEEGMIRNAADQGAWIMAELQRRCGDHPLVGDIRGQGLMIGIELVSDAAKTPAASQAAAVRRYAREHGVLIGVGGTFANVVRIQPPLCINADDAARFCDIIVAGLEQVA